MSHKMTLYIGLNGIKKQHESTFYLSQHCLGTKGINTDSIHTDSNVENIK